MFRLRNALVFLGLLVFSLVILSPSQANAADNHKIKIVTSTDFYGEVAKAVAGNHGDVTSIINNPSVDPHDYEPTTKVASKVSKADIIVENGLNYDPWMSKLAKNAHNAQLINIGGTIMHKNVGDNPHIWYEPTTMTKYANYLADQLGKVQPQNKQAFKENATKYIASLKPVNDEIRNVKKQTTKSQTVYVSEPVFDYAVESLGYKVGNHSFEEAVEKGTDPSPTSIKQMQNGIKNHKIAFFVDNKQVSSKTVKNFVKLAKQNNVPVLKVTETLPAHMNYRQWMLSQYRQLNKILKSESK